MKTESIHCILVQRKRSKDFESKVSPEEKDFELIESIVITFLNFGDHQCKMKTNPI